jgi:hypothetical protein
VKAFQRIQNLEHSLALNDHPSYADHIVAAQAFKVKCIDVLVDHFHFVAGRYEGGEQRQRTSRNPTTLITRQ